MSVMSMAFSILFSLLITFLSAFAQANSCVDIFKMQNEAIVELGSDNIELSGIKIVRDNSPQNIKSKKDPGYRESLKNLLMLLTETQFENISKKETLDKGELRLGKLFDDGLSLEFVYEGDLRGMDSYHLTKIKLIKPNGQSEKLDENPVPDLGLPSENRTILVKKEKRDDQTAKISSIDKKIVEQLFESKELNTPEVQKKVESLTAKLQEVKIPFKIEGVLLESLVTWTGMVKHVTRPKMRERLESDQIERLIWHARAVGSVRWMGKQLNRLVFREIIRSAVYLGLAYNFVLPSIMNQAPSPAQLVPAAQTQTVNRSSQVIDIMAELTRKETARNGSALFYTGSAKDSGLLMTAQAKDSNLIVSLFPKQEKIVIIPDAKTSNDLTPIVLTRAENEKSYDLIAGRLEDLYAGRRR